MIRSKMHPAGFSILTMETLTEQMVEWGRGAKPTPMVLVTAGAGDIDQLYPEILNRLNRS